jgi:hypothetical protein
VPPSIFDLLGRLTHSVVNYVSINVSSDTTKLNCVSKSTALVLLERVTTTAYKEILITLGRITNL